MRTCPDCVYYNQSDTTCRINPPIAELSGNTPVVYWPKVGTSDWCSRGYNSTDGSYDPNAPVVYASPVDASPHAKQVQSR